MRITVFGSSDRTGQYIVEQALSREVEVVAFVRSVSKLPFDDQRLKVVEGDAYRDTNVDEAVAGADAVISTLGQSKGSPIDLLTVAGNHIRGRGRPTVSLASSRSLGRCTH